MRNPNHEFRAGRVVYMFDGAHLWYALPSGRVLCYPYARLDADGVTYAKASWKPGAGATEWPRARLWKGLACENITQAAANDVLRDALRSLDKLFDPNGVVLHVHDEIVLEVPIESADDAAEQLLEIMRDPPNWAEGLPLDAKIKMMPRYGK
jgi:DNA polymerase